MRNPSRFKFFHKGKRKWITDIVEMRITIKDLDIELKNYKEGGEEGEIKD